MKRRYSFVQFVETTQINRLIYNSFGDFQFSDAVELLCRFTLPSIRQV